jgi:AcrR family transcriptional regulator
MKEGREQLVNSKQVIMEASMKLMETKDFNSITIREIAVEAGVNVAAVNYHFGNKTKLFNLLMEEYWEEMMGFYKELLEVKEITMDTAIAFGIKVLKFELRSTGILRSEQVMYQQYGIDEATHQRIHVQMQALSRLVLHLHKGLNQEEIFPKVLMVASSLSCPGFWTELTERYITEVDTFAEAYVRNVMETV